MIKSKLIKTLVFLTIGLFVLCWTLGLLISTTEKPTAETKAEQVNDSKKDIIMADIRQNVEEANMAKATAEDAQEKLGHELLIPKYLPKQFINYGIYMNQDCVKQIWYDQNKLEILYVSQAKSSTKDRESEIIFTDIMPNGHWSKYRTFYEFVQNGMYAQGFMFVQEDNRTEYEKILKSLK
jgi:hypothetical protein